MSKFSKISLANEARVELKEKLGLTSCEVSLNELPAGAEVPFYHSHQQNEELYLFLEGDGAIELDGEKLAIKANDAVRVAPSVMRKVIATSNTLPLRASQRKQPYAMERNRRRNGLSVGFMQNKLVV